MPTVSICHAANISHNKEDAQYTANAAYDVTLERSLVHLKKTGTGLFQSNK